MSRSLALLCLGLSALGCTLDRPPDESLSEAADALVAGPEIDLGEAAVTQQYSSALRRPHVATNGNVRLLVWSEGFGGSLDVYGVRMASNGVER